MPRGNGTGPPSSTGPGTGRGAGRCLSPRSSNSSKTSGSRVERYVGLIEVLVPLASALVALFKKPKVPKNNISALTHVGIKADGSKNLKRGDEYAKR